MISIEHRLHGLDALRAFALFLGVLLHASMSFLPNAQYFWITSDSQQSSIVSVIFFTIHVFRMPLFFLIAGFFAYLALQKKGVRGFIRDRLQRIGVPLVIGWPIIFSMIVAAIVLAAWVKNGGQFPKDNGKGPSFTPNDFPLAHLWFLYVLLLLYAMFLSMWSVLKIAHWLPYCKAIGDKIMPVLASLVGPILLALPVAMSLYQTAYWIQWFGVPTPDRSLYPSLAVWVSYALAFGFGWGLSARRTILLHWQGRWGWYVVAGIGLVAACLVMVGNAPLLMPAPHDEKKFLYAWMYAGAAWYLCFGLIGASLHFLSNANAKIRYMADASYWIYLMHLPLVMALQGVIARSDWHWVIKLNFVLLTTLMLTLVSYHYLVRNTWIGVVLNGKRQVKIKENTAPEIMDIR